MKTTRKYYFLFLSLMVIISISAIPSCRKPDPTGKEINTKLITSKPWMLQSVTVDGVDQTAVYAGMTLSFTATHYTATNGEPIWLATGGWTFTDNSGKIIERADGLMITVISLSSTQLSLGLDWAQTTFGGGRVGSVQGNHVFNFTH